MSSKEQQEQTLAYVFAPLGTSSDNKHAIAGVIDCGALRPYFRYGRSWLENPEAYALDPINLPLGNDPIYCNNRLGVHPVFSDAGPDSWGTKVLLRGHSTVPKNEVERLLATSGAGVGGLRFSLSRTKFKKPPPLPTEDQLAVLEFASEKVEAGVTISNELLQLLAPCSSMGGARPKITYADSNGKPWLAKFTKPNDLLNMPRVEAACLSLAEQLGFDVPAHKVIKLGNDALCVERFDEQDGRHLHYISARSIFNKDRVPADPTKTPLSYPALSQLARQFCHSPSDAGKEIFKRMSYNVAIGNTDDHGQNHGFLFDPVRKVWAPSPVFDVVPVPTSQVHHALALGEEGTVAQWDNVLSKAQYFGLRRSEALELADQVVSSVIASWKACANEHAVSQGDQIIIDKIFSARCGALKEMKRSIGAKSEMFKACRTLQEKTIVLEEDEGGFSPF